ncbi:MAG: hypothetical protein Kow0069_16340 [Promethearchaeota archaeon]
MIQTNLEGFVKVKFKATTFVLVAVLLVGAWGATLPGATASPDDDFEENDDSGHAVDIRMDFEGTFHPSFEKFSETGLVLLDEDWFFIDKSSDANLTVRWSANASKWVDLELWDDPLTTLLGFYHGVTSGPVQLNVGGSYSGKVFLKVNGTDGVEYSLEFVLDYCPPGMEDTFEENDDQGAAKDVTLLEGHDYYYGELVANDWVDHFEVWSGFSRDDDWYKIWVLPNATLDVELWYSATTLNWEILNASGTLWSGTSTWNGATFHVNATEAGQWVWIHVLPTNTDPCQLYRFAAIVTVLNAASCPNDWAEDNDVVATAPSVDSFSEFNEFNDPAGTHYFADDLTYTDLDAWRVTLSGEDLHVFVHSHFEVSLTLTLYDASMSILDQVSQGGHDFEAWASGHTGDVFISITSNNSCFTYMLNVDLTGCLEDDLEENDDAATATDADLMLVWESTSDGYARSRGGLTLADPDWFRLNATNAVAVGAEFSGPNPVNVTVRVRNSTGPAGVLVETTQQYSPSGPVLVAHADLGGYTGQLYVEIVPNEPDECAEYFLRIVVKTNETATDGSDGGDGSDGSNIPLDLSVPGFPAGSVVGFLALAVGAVVSRTRRREQVD